jgi:hypothetical protein
VELRFELSALSLQSGHSTAGATLLVHFWSGYFGDGVGIKDPPVPKTDTQETENLDRQGASMCSLQLSNMQAQNG